MAIRPGGSTTTSTTSSDGLTTTQEEQLETAYDQSHTHDNSNTLDAIEEALTSDLKAYYDNCAQLDDTGKLTTDHIPDSLINGLEWMGTFDIEIDTVDAASSDNSGNFYKISTGGTESVITGSEVTWTVGDWLISNGSEWERVPTSVDSATTDTAGTIQLTGDIEGSYDDIVVSGIQTFPVDYPTSPTEGQTMLINASLDGFEIGSVVNSITPLYDSDAGSASVQYGAFTPSRGFITANELVVIDQGADGGGSGDGAGTPYIIEVRNGVLGIKELSSTWDDS